MAKHRRSSLSNRRAKEIADLNKKIAKKKSNLKQRYGVEVDIPRIDPSLSGKQLREAKDRANDFLNRNNVNYQYVKNSRGEAFPKKLVNEAKRLEKRINQEKKKASRKLMNADFTVQGKVVGKVKDYLGQLKYDKQEFINIKFDLDWFTSEKGVANWLERKSEVYAPGFINKQRQQYKENYIQAIITTFGLNSDTQKIIKEVQAMNVDTLYMKTMSEDLRQFKFIYGGDQLSQKWKGFNMMWNEIMKR